MKTLEEIRKETPLSETTTDNPIVQINELGDILVLVTNKTDKKPSKGIFHKIKKGEKYRFINVGCRLGTDFSALRLGKNDAIWVPNECFNLIYGDVIGLNVKFDEVDHEMIKS